MFGVEVSPGGQHLDAVISLRVWGWRRMEKPTLEERRDSCNKEVAYMAELNQVLLVFVFVLYSPEVSADIFISRSPLPSHKVH